MNATNTGRVGVEVEEVRVESVVEARSSHSCALSKACSVVFEEDLTSLNKVSRIQSRIN